MKIELDGDDWVGIGIAVFIISFFIGVVGPCVQKYGTNFGTMSKEAIESKP